MKKTGKFSAADIAYIETYYKEKSVEDIAAFLHRDPRTIANHIRRMDRKLLEEDAVQQDLLLDLKSRPFWPDLKNQYNYHELELYQFYWGKFIQQFSYDVTPAEELQIMKLIDLEIMLHRNKKERAVVDNEIKDVQKSLEDEQNKPDDQLDKQVIMHCQQIIAGHRAAQLNRSREYSDLLKQHQSLVRELKATRDQRFKDIQEKKISMFAWIKQFDDFETRGRLSRDAELMAMAVDKETERLSKPHKYMDGIEDLPIFNVDTISKVQEEDSEP